MARTHRCTHARCHEEFAKAYELRKHSETHENPESVSHCPHCKFITLRKGALVTHIKTHTGEKNIHCPHTVRSGTDEHRCDYSTNDPAGLFRHREKAHGYVPKTRSRSMLAPASTRKLRQKRVEKPKSSSSRRRRCQPIVPSPRRKAARTRKTKNPESNRGKQSTPAPMLVVNVDENAMDASGHEGFGYESTSATLVGTDDEFGLDVLFDPTLRSQWMAQYEASYTSFDMTGMKHQLENMADDHAFEQAVLDERTGREGCLCPEWMVEAGIEGWDKSVLEAHKEFYAIDA